VKAGVTNAGDVNENLYPCLVNDEMNMRGSVGRGVPGIAIRWGQDVAVKLRPDTV